jgi:hypothetical protein
VSVSDSLALLPTFTTIIAIAKWYDLRDDSRRLALAVPDIAFDELLLLSAMVAPSAIHILQATGNAAARKTVELHHGHCVGALIHMDQTSILLQNGVALAATCLLKSYEIIHGKALPFLGVYVPATRLR